MLNVNHRLIRLCYILLGHKSVPDIDIFLNNRKIVRVTETKFLGGKLSSIILSGMPIFNLCKIKYQKL